jgi:integrase
MAKKRGEWGSIFLRGDVYWVKYYKNGKPYRESTKTGTEAGTSKQAAKDLLIKRYNEIVQGKEPTIRQDRIKFDELAKMFLGDYAINERKSLRRAEISVSHLKESFEGQRVLAITTPAIQEYIRKRREDEGAANATVNRELAALKRMLMLGAKCTPPMVDRVPYIPMLKENNVKKGFFEHGDFLALRDALPDYLKAPATFAYKTGWRHEEVTGLTWDRVDLANGMVSLNAGETKNDQARTVYLDDELKGLLHSLWKKRKDDAQLTPHVFLNIKGTGRLKRFDKAWKAACEKAGVGGKIFHDFRRTASRNMVRAGVPERVAMQITGHRTRSVFERYNIVSDQDLKQAAARQEEYLAKSMGTKTGTVIKITKKKGVNFGG